MRLPFSAALPLTPDRAVHPNNPLIVQSNSSILLEVNNPLFTEARNAVSEFAHLDKSPEHIHSYSITPLSLWNAAALGMTAGEVVERLDRYSKYPLPPNVSEDIVELMGRFGSITLETAPEGLILRSGNADLLAQLCRNPRLAGLLGTALDRHRITVSAAHRGIVKQALISIGYPACDKAGYVDGTPYRMNLRTQTKNGAAFTIRGYQRHAAEAFIGNAAGQRRGRPAVRCRENHRRHVRHEPPSAHDTRARHQRDGRAPVEAGAD
jgi:DNA excision repair protein ERCC-3